MQTFDGLWLLPRIALDGIPDLHRDLRQSFADLGSRPRLVPEVAPVHPLAFGDFFRNGVLRLLLLIGKHGSIDVQQRQDEVVALEFFLPLEEQLELVTAGRAFKVARRDDGYEKRASVDALFDTFLPLLTLLSVIAILKYGE